MAIDPTQTKSYGRKAAPRKKAAGTGAKKATRKTAAPKGGINAKAARAGAAKPAADGLRAAVNERIVKPARAAAEGAYSAAQSAAGSAREAAGNASEGIANAASQGSNFGLKMIEHAEANAREAFNAMRAAARSKDVSEVLKVQGEYLREQGARSLSQAREVADMIAQFGRDAIAPLTERKK